MQEGGPSPLKTARNKDLLTERELEALNMPGLVRQGSLSPNLHTMSSGEGPPLSPADKKRNKLGYHRTAVACGHCRRRKIRCIPAFEDQNGRCQNCIRLKKDCHFFPVEQQNAAPGPKRARKPTDGFVHESETSVSSSPAGGILRSSSFDQLDSGEGVMGTPPLPHDSPGFQYQQVPRSFSSHGMTYPHPYDPNQQAPQSEEFMASPYVSQSPRGYSVDASHTQYYNQYGHPVQGSYPSSFASSSLPSNTTAMSQESIYSYPQGTPNGFQWSQPPVPTRSMSTGEPEELAHGLPHAYRTHTYPSLDRRMAGDMQHMSTPNAGYVPLSMESQPGTIPAQFRDSSSYQPMHVGMQQNWSSGGADHPAQLSGMGGGAYSSGWYPQQEDDHTRILPSQDRPQRRGEHKPG